MRKQTKKLFKEIDRESRKCDKLFNEGLKIQSEMKMRLRT